MAKHTIEWKFEVDVAKVITAVLIFILIVMGYAQVENVKLMVDKLEVVQENQLRLQEGLAIEELPGCACCGNYCQGMGCDMSKRYQINSSNCLNLN
jgi:hypothetical protein